MSKSAKYGILGLGLLLFTGLLLYYLVVLDEQETVFYSSCGIVYFTRWFMLTASLLALFFSGTGLWLGLVDGKTAGGQILTFFGFLPSILASLLISYASLLFLCTV